MFDSRCLSGDRVIILNALGIVGIDLVKISVGPAVSLMVVARAVHGPHQFSPALLFQVMAVVSDSAWALAAGTARAWFARSPKRMSTLSGAGGVMMIGLGGTLALSGAKH